MHRGLTGREVGRRTARRLGEPERAGAIALMVARVERGAAETVYAEPRLLDALAVELGAADGRDLCEPLLHAWAVEDRPVELALALPLFESPEAAYEGRGVLAGIDGGLLPPAFADADLEPLFASDREKWLRRSFDDLADHERAFVLLARPAARELCVLRLVDQIVRGLHDDARRYAVQSIADLAGLAALKILDQLADLAARRLTCDRLRDEPASRHDEWRRQERQLALAQTDALKIAREALART